MATAAGNRFPELTGGLLGFQEGGDLELGALPASSSPAGTIRDLHSSATASVCQRMQFRALNWLTTCLAPYSPEAP